MPEDVRNRMIGERLGELARASHASSPCLDAEMLAAWADGSLSGASAESVEAHLASCADCRAVVTVLGAGQPAGSSPAPQVVVDFPGAQSPPPSMGAPRRRWVLPAGLGAAAAVALWFATTGRGPAELPRGLSVTERAAETARTEPGPSATGPSTGDRGMQAFGQAQSAQQPPASAKDRVTPSSDRSAASGSALPGRTQGSASSLAKSRAGLASPTPAADKAVIGESKVAAAPSAAETLPSPGQTLPAAPLPPPAAMPAPPAPAAAAADAPSANGPLIQSVRRVAPDPRFVVSSPDRSVQWRVRADNTLERSIVALSLAQTRDAAAATPSSTTGQPMGGDGRGGRGQVPRAQGGPGAASTWEPLVLPAGVVLTAGSSPLRDVSWFVGRGGVVVLIDPAGLRQVSTPDRSDLTGIVATSARSASVMTSDGRRFSTDDAGMTWRESP